MTQELVWLGVLSSLLAGASTGIGGLPVLFMKQVSDRTMDTMLGFAAGVMLAATAFSLLILAITIHNFPEGLAVGVSLGGGDIGAGITIALAIALQNIPEGSVVAFPLVREGFGRRKALWIATLTGLVEPFGGIIGVLVVGSAIQLLPYGLAFAGGAMAFVVSHEMIPESHRKGDEIEATFGFIGGFALMMFLDTIFV
jgi:ZIP family zinc transporter